MSFLSFSPLERYFFGIFLIDKKYLPLFSREYCVVHETIGTQTQPFPCPHASAHTQQMHRNTILCNLLIKFTGPVKEEYGGEHWGWGVRAAPGLGIDTRNRMAMIIQAAGGRPSASTLPPLLLAWPRFKPSHEPRGGQDGVNSPVMGQWGPSAAASVIWSFFRRRGHESNSPGATCERGKQARDQRLGRQQRPTTGLSQNPL